MKFICWFRPASERVPYKTPDGFTGGALFAASSNQNRTLCGRTAFRHYDRLGTVQMVTFTAQLDPDLFDELRDARQLGCATAAEAINEAIMLCLPSAIVSVDVGGQRPSRSP